MNYHHIKHCDMVNGDGLRTVIWLSGCSHKCPGCFNPETHCPLSGIKFDKSAKDELFKNLKEDWCDGITFSGGDPLFETNIEEVIEICKEIKAKYPTKTIWLYSGYTYDFIINDPLRSNILNYIDVLCDGPFIEALKDVNKKWVGSSNQNVINIKQRIEQVNSLRHI